MSQISTSVLEFEGSDGVAKHASRHRFTVAELMTLVEQGILQGHAELVDGEILHTAAMGNGHSLCLEDLRDQIRVAFPAPYFVRTQPTHRFTEFNAPEPYIVVLLNRPVPGALIDPLQILVIEVSDETLATDISRKRVNYARFNVQEYWVVDLRRKQVNVFRHPNVNATQPSDAYAEESIVKIDGTLSPLANPTALLRVVDFMPIAG